MKKIVSISLRFLMLIALLHLSVATHYCGGKIAASNISLSGKLASCGMEDDHDILPVTGTNISRHCCDNVLVFVGITGNYFPSFSSVPEPFQNHFQVIGIPADLPLKISAIINTISADASPPGNPLCSSVDLSDICILRI